MRASRGGGQGRRLSLTRSLLLFLRGVCGNAPCSEYTRGLGEGEGAGVGDPADARRLGIRVPVRHTTEDRRSSGFDAEPFPRVSGCGGALGSMSAAPGILWSGAPAGGGEGGGEGIWGRTPQRPDGARPTDPIPFSCALLDRRQMVKQDTKTRPTQVGGARGVFCSLGHRTKALVISTLRSCQDDINLNDAKNTHS